MLCSMVILNGICGGSDVGDDTVMGFIKTKGSGQRPAHPHYTQNKTIKSTIYRINRNYLFTSTLKKLYIRPRTLGY